MAKIRWTVLEHAAKEPVRVGDLLSADAGGMPIYRVEAVSGGVISLRNEAHPPVQTTSLDAFLWKAAAG